MFVRGSVQVPNPLEKAILGKADPVFLGVRLEREGAGLPVGCCLHLVTEHSQ